MTASNEQPAKERGNKKALVGHVSSAKMQKTIVVEVVRRMQHPLYGKFINRTQTFMAHDEQGVARPGDKVKIMETRPMSKNKRWRLVEVVEKAVGVVEDKSANENEINEIVK